MSLSGRAARGAAHTVLGQWIRFVVQLGALAGLSRLLDPTEYGIVTMVTAIVGIAAALSDFGLSLAAVQRTDISQGQKSNLLWLNIGFSGAVSLIVWLCAPAISSFYHQPQVADVTRALSVVFLLNGVAAQFRAEMNRSLRFGSMVVIDTAAQVVGSICGVGAALLGFSYWSLVIMQIVTAGVLCALYVVRSGWVPTPPDRTAEMRPLLKFGLGTMGTQAMNYASSNADSISIGRFWGADNLGVYNRAFQLFNLPLQQLAAPMTRVAVPILSRVAGTESYSRYLIRAQRVLCWVLLLLLAFVAGVAPQIIEIVLGPKWLAGVPILRALAVGGVFQTLGYTYYWIYLSSGRMGRLFVFEGVGRIGMIMLVVAGATVSPLGAAIGYSLGLLMIWFVSGLGLRGLGIAAGPLIRVSILPLGLAIPTAIVGWWIGPLVQAMAGALVSILVSAVLMVALVLLSAVLVSPIRRDLKTLVDTAKRIRQA